MKIELGQDYRGYLTGEVFYRAGAYEAGVDMHPAHAAALVQSGRAVVVEDVEADEPEPQPAPRVMKKGRKGGL